MNYRQVQPPDYLKSYIRYFWILETDAIDNASKTFRPITDGCPGLFFQQAETSTFYDQDRKQLPALFLYGQTIRHREIHTSGNFNAIGICFYPYALKSVFGFDANELTDTCADLNVLSEKQGFFLLERLLNAPSTTQQIELVSAYLWTQIRKNNVRQDGITQYALSQLLESNGTILLKDLHEKLTISERNLERKFKQSVGISPKLFSRICRFQASLNQLRINSYDKLSDIAFENGYADQSHFIRAFKEFAGVSPDKYRKQSTEVIQNLTEWVR